MHQQDGRPQPGSFLADGFFLVLWGLLADLDHMAVAFGFLRANNKSPCGCCGANSDGVPWTDCHNTGPNTARWLSAIWSRVTWLAAHHAHHIIFDAPGFSIECWVPDWMHCKHLGTDVYFYASILAFLVYHMLPGNAADNLEMVWDLLLQP